MQFVSSPHQKSPEYIFSTTYQFKKIHFSEFQQESKATTLQATLKKDHLSLPFENENIEEVPLILKFW